MSKSGLYAHFGSKQELQLAAVQQAAREDPDLLAFELDGIMLATDTNFVLHDDPAVLNLAREIVHQRLGAEKGRKRRRKA